MARTILIVDDLALNREILKGILRKDYDILEAGGGSEALTLMYQQHRMISAVLLDIMMPDMDGYEVLRQMRASDTISQIPVIMITGSEDEQARVKCLALGANDFVMKPYNPDIIRHCLRNNIALRETEATVHALQRDRLTGLFNRELFFEKVQEMVSSHEPGYYIMAYFDIDKFKVINDQYGIYKGDEVLRYIAGIFKEGFEANGGICCRVAADDFAVLYPSSFVNSDKLAQMRKDAATVDGLISPVTFSIGRYTVSDLSLSPSAMYDRAMLAAESVKGLYDVHIAEYDESMRNHLLSEQEIVTEMDQALKDGQFEIWFQPQYNHSTDALIGSEALVRWRHPQKGLIPPGLFIPIFEKNGFVYELDKYVWEQACIFLRQWTDEGLDPLPVSVNVSRYDIFRPGLADTIIALVKKHRLPASLLRLEITESAFSKSSTQIIAVVQRLIDIGFTVEIDDFGSGYSSLNTLKDVPAQVLKLDMKFLESNSNSLRGGNIVESIVRMAKWLDMSVIAEGVETLEQANFLRSIGCNYIQGYLYARPMPAADYKALCAGFGKEERLLALETVENLDNISFWDPKSMDTLIFNSFVGAACIYEYHKGNIELLRATEKFAQVMGGTDASVEDAIRLNLTDHLDSESARKIIENLDESIRTKKEITDEYVYLDLPGCPHETFLRSTMRIIASAGDRYLVYCTNQNITAQRKAEQKERQVAEEMRLIMSNVNGGICAAAYLPDGDVRIIFANRQFYSMYGYTRDQFEAELFSPLDAIHPDDRDKTMDTVAKLVKSRSSGTYEYRCIKRDGSVINVCCNNAVTSFSGISDTVLLSVTTDTTELIKAQEKERQTAEKMQAIMDNVDLGVTATIVQDGRVQYLFANERYYALLKYTRTQFEKEVASPFLTISELDRQRIAQAAENVSLTRKTNTLEYRALCRDGSEPWFRTTIAAGSFAGVDGVVQLAIYRDITEEKTAEMALHDANIKLDVVINSIPGGVATYKGVGGGPVNDMRLVFFSDGLCRLLGYTREEYAELSKTHPVGRVFKEDSAMIAQRINALISNEEPMDCVYRVHTKDGGYRWIDLKVVITEHKNGEITANAVFFDVTARQDTLEKLRVSEEENRLAIQHSQTTVCRYDVASRSLTVSPHVNPIFEASSVIKDIPYGEVKKGNISSESAASYIAFYEKILRGEKNGELIYQRVSLSGWRWLEARFSTIFSDDGEPVSAVISFADVTDRLEKETIYKKWQQSLADKDPRSYSLYRCNLNKDASYDTAEGELLDFDFDSLQASLSFNLRAQEYVSRRVFDEDKDKYLAFVNSDTLLANYYCGKRSGSIEYRELLADGAIRWLRLSVELLEYPNSTDVEAYLMYEDAGEEKQRELRAKELSENDPLTGVLNRSTFMTRIEKLIESSGPERLHALLLLDIDGFRSVNEIFGHTAGDKALIDIANSLRSIVGKNDLLGRIGGDEFAVLFADIPGDAYAANMARQICALARKAFSLEIQISGSVGIVVIPRDGTDREILSHKLDLAVSYVKGFGRNNYAFYREDMEEWRFSPEDAENGNELTQRKTRKRRMLIVDDNDMDLELLGEIFTGEYIVEKAKDGNSALTCLRYFGSAISIVLLDLMMPGVDGFDVLEKMLADPELRTVPVIVVSGDENYDTCLKAITNGASDFVNKPVDNEMLRARVRAAISRSENERMRAQSSYRMLQNSEMTRYKTILERSGILVAEVDWINNKYAYDPAISSGIAGKFDDRPLWRILLSDMVSDAQTVQKMQLTVHELANDRSRLETSLKVQLKTPSGGKHSFIMTVYKLVNEFGLADKLILTFRDLET